MYSCQVCVRVCVFVIPFDQINHVQSSDRTRFFVFY